MTYIYIYIEIFFFFIKYIYKFLNKETKLKKIHLFLISQIQKIGEGKTTWRMKRTYWSLNPKIQHYLTLSHLFFKQELTPKAPNPTPSFSLFSTFPQFQLYYQWTSQTSSLAICELHPYQMDHQISSLQTTIRMRSTALLETSCGYLLQELQARVFCFFLS